MGKVSIQQFKKDFVKEFEQLYAYSYDEGTPREQFLALGEVIRNYYMDNWKQTISDYKTNETKQIFYFSMEFLPGRMLKSNLLNLDVLKTVQDGLKELGLNLDEVSRGEADPALGNGGLGRLASCFMDSIASTGLAGHGNGIRYQYGLFKQKFIDGYQIELPENWLRNGNVWEVRKENKAVIVRFGGQVYLEPDEAGRLYPRYENTQNILAVPYDVPQVGYKNGVVNNLRLWSAEIPYGEEYLFRTEEERDAVNQITEVLYPDDSNYEGRLLRLRQEYFFSSAGVQSVIRYFKILDEDWSLLPDKIGIHINDTHPALVVPELMRILIDEEGLTWNQAWEITKKTISYTNHTILQEAMERWPVDMMAHLLPRIYQIIVEINHRHIEKKLPLYGEELTYRTAIIDHDQIKMANLAIIGSHSINGVAKLHTNILINETLHDFYLMYPNKFNNKTNGITQRRWVQLSNPALTELLDDTIGTDWKCNPEELILLKAHADDKTVLDRLETVKLENKKRFAAYVKKEMGIEIDPTAIFDVQIKRLHAYKRQLLNVLHILERYNRIKDNPDIALPKRVFIFGAKAAPSYHYAKQIIKLINAVAEMVNNDPEIRDLIKVVFVENYGVSLAELIIPAADISEQISLAGKEASGTSNMKLMANGAVTMATMDGATIEIHDAVGKDNIYIFGLKNEEVQKYYQTQSYHSRTIYEGNASVKRVLNMLIDGSIPGIFNEGQDIFDSLVKFNDEYFLLKDFDSYINAQTQADIDFLGRDKWNKMALLNIAHSGPFSSDYTILRYADEIWKIEPQVDDATPIYSKVKPAE
ncbi:MAG TPA: glycogen/starch/alpha-glucan phosphorylase [Candidatus Jeotgalibaca merdavium]|uniref:Alpha-1,4 glucan phosphorylase n=2 Tax=Jeotgalibaca TaxID=1470540 RepID=A0A6G7K7A1_9LACT|nr:glycogen/starch/alpha-glucan phosphorylase [Jeotgalibaca arthritidis]QII81130.1 glycogen/starch/alpha-glucan phosphorylase [Jeotgalibaca arthritidis]HJA90254.1 glycogen/starch/alpha-glucan phosphorylase [Candidatus Jeotgalibaca merdavium]